MKCLSPVCVKENVTTSVLFSILGFNNVRRKEKNIFQDLVDFAKINYYFHTYSTGVCGTTNTEVKSIQSVNKSKTVKHSEFFSTKQKNFTKLCDLVVCRVQ